MNKSFFPFRFVLVFFTFLFTVLMYIDRACISTAKDPIMKDLGLSTTDMGWIMAIFTLGYALSQIPSGKLADKRGSKFMITAILAIWTILTTITGRAWNFISLFITRFVFGAGEAGVFPSLSKVVFNWFPVKERGLIQGINFSGSRLGAALGLPMVAFLIQQVGWRGTFGLFGIVGVLFIVIWHFLFRDKPENSKLVSEAEKTFIIANRQKSSTSQMPKLSYKQLFASKNVWLAMLQYICSNFTFYFTLTWMYPYIKEKFMLESVEAGMYASLPLIGGAMGNWVSGFLVDYLYKKGHVNFSRRLPAMFGFFLAAIGMIMVTNSDSSFWSIIFMTIAVFGADMTLSPSWAFCIDIGKENSGTVSGTMNMAGNMGAFVTIIAYPYLLQWTGSKEPFFYTCAFLSVIAIATWWFMKPENELKVTETI